jgi:hypothetical protein
MAARVFISYRRDESGAHAGRVYDRLEREFGREGLFIDVDALRLGVNFVRVIREEVAKCDVLLAIIGPNWLNARDEEGNRRLDIQNDYVRIEIAAALQRDIPVIPILFDGARIPKADHLPKDLEELANRNALDVRNAFFRNDIDKLIQELKDLSGEDAPEPSASRTRSWVVASVAALVILLSVGVIYALIGTPRLGVRGINTASKNPVTFTMMASREAMSEAGNSLGIPTSGSIGDCQTQCASSEECHVFTYNKTRNVCYLYTHAELRLNPDYDTGERR